MAINESGGVAASAANATGLQPHDATGALAHWSFDGTTAELITGGAGYDLTITDPCYIGVNPLGTQHKCLTTAERAPGVTSMNAALKLTGDMTCAGWFCLGENPTNAGMLLFGAGAPNASAGYWGLKMNGSITRLPQCFWFTSTTGQYVTGTTKFEVGEWHHLCMTRGVSGTRGRIYVDGILEGEDTGLTNVSTTYTQINMGHTATGTNSHVNLFSCVLFNSELDATAVQALYESTLASGA